MTEYTINIEDNDILVRVYNQTANAALQRNDAQAVATEDNEAMVNVFIEDGKKLLEKALGRYSTGALAYSMPDTWPDRHEEVDSYADTFLKNYALAKWYELSGTGERFINAANEALENIVTILGKRTKPNR